jgi:hypothetical protein
VIDLCLAIAAKQSWRGRTTRKGLVIYVAGEGAASVRMRVVAYRTANPDVGSLPFAIVPFAVDFLSAESVACLIGTIKAAESDCGEKVVLVVADTFARSIPGANENDAQDVGIAVAAGDKIRIELDCCVGFVHHAGKDPSKGARGSSALRAAVDTEVLIEKGQDGRRTATVTKQRDLMVGSAMPFELVPVTVGTHEDGADITSCVVKQVDAVEPSPTRRYGKNQERLETALKEFRRTHPTATHIASSDVAAMFKAQAIPAKRRREVLDSFVNARVLAPAVGGHTFHGENL